LSKLPGKRTLPVANSARWDETGCEVLLTADYQRDVDEFVKRSIASSPGASMPRKGPWSARSRKAYSRATRALRSIWPTARSHSACPINRAPARPSPMNRARRNNRASATALRSFLQAVMATSRRSMQQRNNHSSKGSWTCVRSMPGRTSGHRILSEPSQMVLTCTSRSN
jgi:hypothetical protein